MATITYSDGTPPWVVTALTAAAGPDVKIVSTKAVGDVPVVSHHGGSVAFCHNGLTLWRLEAIVGYLLESPLSATGQRWFDRLDRVLTSQAGAAELEADIAAAVHGKFLVGENRNACDVVLAAWTKGVLVPEQGDVADWVGRSLGKTAPAKRAGGGVAAAVAQAGAAGGGEKFFLTTAINYTNGDPHVGHAYEGITADVIARYHRRFGRDVFAMTGTDEHGQKIAEKAEKEGVTPLENCTKYANKFKKLNSELHTSFDYFIRTTDAEHKKSAQALWTKCSSAGDIYLGKYVGWYDVKEETFVTDAEAEAAGFKGPNGNPLEKKNEPSYFFKMSAYHDKLVAHIESNPAFIQPHERRAEIMDRLQNSRLRDLSISRSTFTWGVPVPGDKDHVMYVWFDALSNYATGVHAVLGGSRAKFWPPQVHIIGKDIIWFHCVIWPCMLMSAGMPLPKAVLAHGFVMDKFGKKMSKSDGNVVDPFDVLSKPVHKEPRKGQPEGSGGTVAGYPADLVRLFCMRRAALGADLRFSELDLKRMNNKEVCFLS